MKNSLKKTVAWLKEAIFPSSCVSCGHKTFGLAQENKWLCPACTNSLKPFWRTICAHCGKESSILGKKSCACSKQYLKNVSFLFDYSQTSLRPLIHTFKYRFVLDIVDIFTPIFKKEKINLLRIPADIIIPLPLHKKKLRERGFNQSELIASGLARIINIPTDTNTLLKHKNTPAQMKMQHPIERSRNVAGVFGLNNPENIKNKTVLLVDDVLTTGATMEEAAKTLVLAGAKRVYGFVLARD